jgi:hypothetical protein
MVGYTCIPSYSGGRGRRTMVSAWSQQKCETLSEKQTKKAKDCSVAQGVEYLLSKNEALRSISSTSKKFF